MDYTGTGNSPQRAAPALAAADHGLAALLGHRDARRRLPLRPRRRRWPASSTTSTGSSTFFELVQQDPVVSQVKLIAEPWDVGPGGYQVGNFPPQWTEWNGNYRDTVRDFWRGEPVARRVRLPRSPAPPTSTSTPAAGRSPASTSSPPTTASRCATSCPTTRSTTRPTARTTTTARATTARGTTASRARPTTRRSSRLRAREQRNFLATLLLSQGVPMLLHGDELGRTQDGNNNTYAQDSEISLGALGPRRQAADRVHRRASPGCGASTRPSAASASSPAARCAPATASALNDIVWLHLDGRPMEDERLGRRRTGDRDVPQRPRHRRQGRPRRSASPTTTSCSTSTPTARPR